MKVKAADRKKQRDKFWKFRPERKRRRSSETFTVEAVFYVMPEEGIIDVDPSNDAFLFSFQIEIINDFDEDGIDDERDNCPDLYNPDQLPLCPAEEPIG